MYGDPLAVPVRKLAACLFRDASIGVPRAHVQALMRWRCPGTTLNVPCNFHLTSSFCGQFSARPHITVISFSCPPVSCSLMMYLHCRKSVCISATQRSKRLPVNDEEGSLCWLRSSRLLLEVSTWQLPFNPSRSLPPLLIPHPRGRWWEQGAGPWGWEYAVVGFTPYEELTESNQEWPGLLPPPPGTLVHELQCTALRFCVPVAVPGRKDDVYFLKKWSAVTLIVPGPEFVCSSWCCRWSESQVPASRPRFYEILVFGAQLFKSCCSSFNGNYWASALRLYLMSVVASIPTHLACVEGDTMEVGA